MPTTNTNPASVTLMLSVDEANTLLGMLGYPTTGVEPSPDPAVARDEALVGRLYSVLGDFLVASGGATATPVLLARAGHAAYLLSDSEADLRRYTASDKLSTLGDACYDLADQLRYPADNDAGFIAGSYRRIHNAFDALGRATRGKLPADVAVLVSSLPVPEANASTPEAASCDTACGCE